MYKKGKSFTGSREPILKFSSEGKEDECRKVFFFGDGSSLIWWIWALRRGPVWKLIFQYFILQECVQRRTHSDTHTQSQTENMHRESLHYGSVLDRSKPVKCQTFLCSSDRQKKKESKKGRGEKRQTDRVKEGKKNRFHICLARQRVPKNRGWERKSELGKEREIERERERERDRKK